MNFRTEELWDRHSNWMMSTRLLLCMPRNPVSISRPSSDSMQSRKNAISWLLFGFSRKRSIPIAYARARNCVSTTEVMTAVRNCGNLRRTMVRTCRPSIFGILRSEISSEKRSDSRSAIARAPEVAV